MKLSKIYSNQEKFFEPINFNDGFNVVYGDIRNPNRDDLDTHNLGKTKLANLIDFMFLKERKPKQFLFKHYELFEQFTFFLELKLLDGSYLTIRRSVESNTRIFFYKHKEPNQNLTTLNDEFWTHDDVSIDNAKQLLEGWFNFDLLNQYHYRKVIGYLIRTQNDFNNVFKLGKHLGKDIEWKPYIADLLGFNGSLATDSYKKQSEINKLKDKISSLALSDMENINQELSKIDNKLLLRQKELVKIEKFVDDFNFKEIDQERIEQLVTDIDNEIANLNIQEYSVKNNINRIDTSLSTAKIKFNTNQVNELFEEVNILFPEQISKDFEQLITFNKAITKERKKYLKEELYNLEKELVLIHDRLNALNEERANQLDFLSETVLIKKFKKSNEQVAKIQAEINFLEKQKENIHDIQSLSKNKRFLEDELHDIQDEMESDLNEINQLNDTILSRVRIYFNEIIHKVFNKEGSILVYFNKQGNFEFEVNYQDIQGGSTSESEGNTYGKFLCMAFDLAVARAYLDKNYPKFLYIDGALEVLDNRKRKLLLEVLREYSNLGIQVIITSISSEISGFSENPFDDIDFILKLHDNGASGRLFKMPIW